MKTLKAWNGKEHYTYKGRLVPFNKECQLFNSGGGKWWLYYKKNRATGGFKTKKAAMDWYNDGGR